MLLLLCQRNLTKRRRIYYFKQAPKLVFTPVVSNPCFGDHMGIQLFVNYSGDLKNYFYLFDIQIVWYSDARYHNTRHLNSGLVFKWCSEFWFVSQMVIWIPLIQVNRSKYLYQWNTGNGTAYQRTQRHLACVTRPNIMVS